MKTKNLKIQVPEGYEIDKENSTFDEIVFKKIEDNLPKSWEELKIVGGYYVSGSSNIVYFDGVNDINKNLFPTKEEAEACLALAQLCQLRDIYNDGWKPNYKDDNVKYLLYYWSDTIIKSHTTGASNLLTFKTKELRDKFLENFEDLIWVARPLL